MCYVITRVASLVWTKSRVFKLAMSASNSLRFSRNVLRKDSKLSPSLSREARSFYEKSTITKCARNSVSVDFSNGTCKDEK